MKQTIEHQELKTWNTYQIMNSSDIITNQAHLRVNKINTYYDILYNYSSRQFTFFSYEIEFLQKINATPGEYFNLIFPCDNCKLITQKQSKNLQILTCLDNQYQSFKEIQYQPNFNLLTEEIYQNSNFLISIWVKQVNQDDGLNELQFYKLQELQFTMNFRTQKFVYLNKKQDFLNLKQKLYINQWYYFQVQSKQINNYYQENQLLIKSSFVEQYQYQIENASFLFQNKLLLYCNNIIYFKFLIKFNKQLIEEDLCQPDCMVCKDQKCKICKNNLQLYDNICKCPKPDQFTDWDGICKYQLNFLELEEWVAVERKCQFGYYSYLGECIQCPYIDGVLDINCLSNYNDQQKQQLVNFKSNFVKAFNQLTQTYSKFKCPQGCSSCILKNKMIICNYCAYGTYLFQNICIRCLVLNCETCKNASTCIMCQDEYSLNENQQCEYTQQSSFEQFNNYLGQQFQQDLKNCQFNLGLVCYICKQGYWLKNGVCSKYKSFSQIYDQKSIQSKINYGYVHSIKQDLFHTDLLDLYKIQFETSLKNQIIINQYYDKLPVYYSTNTTTYSFCKQYKNCSNFMTFNFDLIQTLDNKSNLIYQNSNSQILFDNLDSAFSTANLYDSIKFIQINIISKEAIVLVEILERILYLQRQNYKYEFHLQFNNFNIQAIGIFVFKIDSFDIIKFINCRIRSFLSLIIQIKSSFFEIIEVILDGNVGFDLQANNISIHKLTVQYLKMNLLGVFFINQDTKVQVYNLKLIECQLIGSSVFFLNSTQINLVIQDTYFQDIYLNVSQFVMTEFIKPISYAIFIYNLTIVKFYVENSQLIFLPPQFQKMNNSKKQLRLTDIYISDSILIKFTSFIINSLDDAYLMHFKNITLNNLTIDSNSHLIFIQNVYYFNMEKTLFQNFKLKNCSAGLIYINTIYQIVINETIFQSFQGTSLNSSLLKLQSNLILIYKFNFKNTNYLQLYKILNIESNASMIQYYEINHLSKEIGYFQLQHDLNILSSRSIRIDKINYINVDLVGSYLIRVEYIKLKGNLQISSINSRNLKLQAQNKFEEKQSVIQIADIAFVNISYLDLNIQINQTTSTIFSYILEQIGEFISIVRYSQFDIKDYGTNSKNQIFQMQGPNITFFGINILYQSQSTQKATILLLITKKLYFQRVFFEINDQNCQVMKVLNKKGNHIYISNIHFKQSTFNDFIDIIESQFDIINISQLDVKANIQEQLIRIDNKQDNSQIYLNGVYFTQLGVQSIKFIAVSGYSSRLFLQNMIYRKNQQSQFSNRIVVQFSGKSIFAQRVQLQNLKQNVLKINSVSTKISNLIILRLENKQHSIDIISQQLLVNDLRFIDCNQINSSLFILNTRQFRLQSVLFKNNTVSNGQLLKLFQEQVNQNSIDSNSNQNIMDPKKNNSIIDGLISYGNICTKQCYIFETKLQKEKIQVKNSFYIEDQALVLNQALGINIFFLNIINIKTKLGFDQVFIDPNSVIQINNSYLVISSGIITNNNQNLKLYNSFYKNEYDKYLNDTIQIPDKLELKINQQNEQIRLLEQKQDSLISFMIDFQFYGIGQYVVYFPSGQQLKNYRILEFKSKQFKDYINFIHINGIYQQNIKISLNKCLLYTNIEDNTQIHLYPNYINSEIKLSDIILISNPYVIQQFTLQVQCIYQNITLQLNIDARVFKCQIGEILQNNQCQQCNITNNQYSVNKRSQLCKYIDHNVIEDYKIGLLKLKQGYWRPNYSNDQIELCKTKENCLGGWNVDFESCQIGYLGPLCNECDFQNVRGDGFYSKYKQQCFTCQYNINVFYIIVIVIIQLITLIITTRSQYLNNQRYQQLIFTNRYYKILNKLSIDQISVVFKQIQNYFFYIQFIDLTFEVDLNLGIFGNFVSNPIQLLNPYYDCISQHYNYSIIIKILMQIVTPLFIVILFYILILMVHKFYKFQQLFVFIYVPLLYFFIIYQIIIFQNSLSQITFVTISGIKYINGSRSLQFYEQSNINQFVFSTIILITFAIIIPSALIYILKKKRTQLYNKTLLMKIGYLYQEYKNQIYFWEFYKMGFKMLFITISYQLLNQKEQSLLLLCIYIFIILSFLRNFQPFNLTILNRFDTKLHTQLLITLLFIYMLVSQLFIKQVVILFLYLSNSIQFCELLWFLMKKFFQTNPILIDIILVKTLRMNFKSQVQKKEIVFQQFQKMKKFIKSKGSQRSLESVYTNRPYSIQVSNIQSVQTEKNQEIEMIRIR